jgi:hypothetical protein
MSPQDRILKVEVFIFTEIIDDPFNFNKNTYVRKANFIQFSLRPHFLEDLKYITRKKNFVDKYLL